MNSQRTQEAVRLREVLRLDYERLERHRDLLKEHETNNDAKAYEDELQKAAYTSAHAMSSISESLVVFDQPEETASGVEMHSLLPATDSKRSGNSGELDIEALEQQLTELNEIFRMLDVMVRQQKETVDSIESNVTRAGENVKKSSEDLRRAVWLKTAAFGLTFGAIGAAVGGPVGLFVGLKSGLAVSAVGGVGGVVVGNYVKNKVRGQAAIEYKDQ